MRRELCRTGSTIQLLGVISKLDRARLAGIQLIKCRLPEDMSLDLGALLEPLSVAIQASKRAQLATGATVLVFGAGAVGLLVAAMAKISGAGTVVIADIDAGRVQFAVDNKFAHRGFTVPLKRGNTIEEQLEIAKETAAEIGKISKESGGEVSEVDAVFECTGVPSCVQASIFVRLKSTCETNQLLIIDRQHDQAVKSCSSAWAHPSKRFPSRQLRSAKWTLSVSSDMQTRTQQASKSCQNRGPIIQTSQNWLHTNTRDWKPQKKRSRWPVKRRMTAGDWLSRLCLRLARRTKLIYEVWCSKLR